MKQKIKNQTLTRLGVSHKKIISYKTLLPPLYQQKNIGEHRKRKRCRDKRKKNMVSLCNKQKYFDEHKNLMICQTKYINQSNVDI